MAVQGVESVEEYRNLIFIPQSAFDDNWGG